MKNIVWTLLLLMSASLSALAQAPAPPPSAPAATAAPAAKPVPGSKIAVMDFRRALIESDAGVAATLEFEKGIAPEKAKLEKLQKEMEDLQIKSRNATDAEKVGIAREMEKKTTDGQRLQEDAQRVSGELQDRLLSPVAELVQKSVAQYAKSNDLVLVLDPITEPNNIVFANTASDITSEVVRIMNAEYAKMKAAGTAPATPSTPAAPAASAPAATPSAPSR